MLAFHKISESFSSDSSDPNLKPKKLSTEVRTGLWTGTVQSSDHIKLIAPYLEAASNGEALFDP